MKLTHFDITTINSALSILGNRKMANINGDLKVARLLRIFSAESKIINKGRNRISIDATDRVDLKELTDIERYRLQAIISGEIDSFNGVEVELLVPDIRLKEVDLPKELTGDDGWKNANQLGAIVADLGPLFEDG